LQLGAQSLFGNIKCLILHEHHITIITISK
jgi:hypothetical protein